MTVEPQTREGKRLKNWWEREGEPFECDKFDFFDTLAAVVLDHPEREHLPIEEELERRMVEALKKEIGAMMTAPDEEWVKAARSIITRLGIVPVVYTRGGMPNTFVMEER